MTHKSSFSDDEAILAHVRHIPIWVSCADAILVRYHHTPTIAMWCHCEVLTSIIDLGVEKSLRESRVTIGVIDKCTKVAILRFCFAAPPATHFWGKRLLSCYHSCRIFLMHKRKFCSSATARAECSSPDKSSAVLLPQLQNVSHQSNILLSCYYKDRMFPTREIFYCSGTIIAGIFFLCVWNLTRHARVGVS